MLRPAHIVPTAKALTPGITSITDNIAYGRYVADRIKHFVILSLTLQSAVFSASKNLPGVFR
jgi:hypothetical protein